MILLRILLVVKLLLLMIQLSARGREGQGKGRSRQGAGADLGPAARVVEQVLSDKQQTMHLRRVTMGKWWFASLAFAADGAVRKSGPKCCIYSYEGSSEENPVSLNRFAALAGMRNFRKWKVCVVKARTFRRGFTLLMWREVQPMGYITNYCLHPGLQALLVW